MEWKWFWFFLCCNLVCGPFVVGLLTRTPMFEWYLCGKISSYEWTSNQFVLQWDWNVWSKYWRTRFTFTYEFESIIEVKHPSFLATASSISLLRFTSSIVGTFVGGGHVITTRLFMLTTYCDYVASKCQNTWFTFNNKMQQILIWLLLYMGWNCSQMRNMYW